jgi:hypothetical protein
MPAIADAFSKTVSFLCAEETDDYGEIKIVPQATAFFVRVPVHEDYPGTSMDYLVTARHCVEEANAIGKAFLRINTTEGHFDVVTKPADWVSHDSADVAAVLMLPTTLPKGVKTTDLDQGSIPVSTFVGPAYRFEGELPGFGPVSVEIGTGDELYLFGLFSQNYGAERNLPVARSGHISRMPSEVTLTSNETNFQIIAYLAELLSWGGISGSPVFFRHPILLETQAENTSFELAHISALLGFVSGHYEIQKMAKTQGDVLGTVQVKMNSGIAMVTPAHNITDLLMREDVVEARRKLAQSIVDQGQP